MSQKDAHMEFSLCQGWKIAKLRFPGPCFYNIVTQNQPKVLLCPGWFLNLRTLGSMSSGS